MSMNEEKQIQSQKIENFFDELNPNYYLDFDDDEESIPTAYDLNGYYFLEYLPDLSKEERKSLLNK